MPADRSSALLEEMSYQTRSLGRVLAEMKARENAKTGAGRAPTPATPRTSCTRQTALQAAWLKAAGDQVDSVRARKIPASAQLLDCKYGFSTAASISASSQGGPPPAMHVLLPRSVLRLSTARASRQARPVPPSESRTRPTASADTTPKQSCPPAEHADHFSQRPKVADRSVRASCPHESSIWQGVGSATASAGAPPRSPGLDRSTVLGREMPAPTPPTSARQGGTVVCF